LIFVAIRISSWKIMTQQWRASMAGAANGNSAIRYLSCQVAPGMFRGEFLVYFNGFHLEDPEKQIKIQMLVDEKEVKVAHGEPKRNRPAQGWVKVTLASEKEGISRIILPQPAQPVGESMLIKTQDLRLRPG
jgi:hypothetical protein